MNQEFVLPATPGLARRLVQLAAISDTQIDAAIRALAGEALVTAEALRALPLKIVSPYVPSAVQKLIDAEFRALLCSAQSDDARQAVMAACALAGERPLVIASDAPERWRALADALGQSVGADPRHDVDMLLIPRSRLIEREVIERRRDGVLILESSNDALTHHCEIVSAGQNIVNEFQKTVILGQFGPYLRHGAPWPFRCDDGVQNLTTLLHADVPAGLFAPQKFAPARGLRQRGFANPRRAEIYEMLGVITDLMGSQGPSD